MSQHFGGFTEEALAAYQKALAEREGADFSEGDAYDFTTCIRPDGSAYGTGGRCRKGTEGEANKSDAKSSSGVPVLTKDDMKKMSESELRGVKKQMDERAFGKDSKPLSDTMLKVLSDQNKAINEELASRAKDKESGEQPKVTATPGMAARVKAAKEKLKADKKANGGKRLDRIQEERRLEQNRKQRGMDKKVKANQGIEALRVKMEKLNDEFKTLRGDESKSKRRKEISDEIHKLAVQQQKLINERYDSIQGPKQKADTSPLANMRRASAVARARD